MPKGTISGPTQQHIRVSLVLAKHQLKPFCIVSHITYFLGFCSRNIGNLFFRFHPKTKKRIDWVVFMTDFVVSVQIHAVGENCWTRQPPGGEANLNLYHLDSKGMKLNGLFPTHEIC